MKFGMMSVPRTYDEIIVPYQTALRALQVAYQNWVRDHGDSQIRPNHVRVGRN